jgi:chorismate-pyruvate lyase
MSASVATGDSILRSISLGRSWLEDGHAERRCDPRVDAKVAADLLWALHAELVRHDSATLALESWCRRQGVDPATTGVVAQRMPVAHKAPAPEQRVRLGVTTEEPVRYRRVRLSCSGCVLSEAENWYVPGRLTAAMNRLLEHSDTPFGRVIRPLGFRRHLLAVQPLWSRGAGDGCIPEHVLRHRALLVGSDGLPLCEVLETYTRDALFLARRPA